MKTISLSDLVTKIQSNSRSVLVEALPARYFEQGHLPGAVNINVGETQAKAPHMLPNKGADIVVYCASATCTNSNQVAAQLCALDYTNVSVFKGGKAEWEAAGHSLEGVPA